MIEGVEVMVGGLLRYKLVMATTMKDMGYFSSKDVWYTTEKQNFTMNNYVS
jgi:hypothetical protein